MIFSLSRWNECGLRQMLPRSCWWRPRGRPGTLKQGLECNLTKGPLSLRELDMSPRSAGGRVCTAVAGANLYFELTWVRGPCLKPDTFQMYGALPLAPSTALRPQLHTLTRTQACSHPSCKCRFVLETPVPRCGPHARPEGEYPRPSWRFTAGFQESSSKSLLSSCRSARHSSSWLAPGGVRGC